MRSPVPARTGDAREIDDHTYDSRSSTTSASPAPPHDAPPGAYASAAIDLRRRGLAVLPVGGPDGKAPLLRGWARWERPQAAATVRGMAAAERMRTAGLAVVTGQPSGVTIVDLDDATLLGAMLRRYGDTPLQTRTPSGGVHLWYRHAGEPSGDLRREGLAVDIRGRGGIAVVPPSVRPSGAHAGKRYEIIAGGWDDLPHLPTMRQQTPTVTPGTIRAGSRNRWVLQQALRELRYCDTLDQLIDRMRTLADQHIDRSDGHPFTDAEIERACRSAWQMEREGRNWVGRERQIVTPESEHRALLGCPDDAVRLYLTLRVAHRSDTEQFALAAAAMAEAEVVAGWRHPRRYRMARSSLVQAGLLRVVHRGRRRGDPSQYTWGHA